MNNNNSCGHSGLYGPTCKHPNAASTLQDTQISYLVWKKETYRARRVPPPPPASNLTSFKQYHSSKAPESLKFSTVETHYTAP
jgi:hypothetical protein